ncbi:MAG: hypothetical protein FWD05_11580 [Oscillospiraceae bacterium]|nr:hypothetical protein [Oscillospiraceae bacterium]
MENKGNDVSQNPNGAPLVFFEANAYLYLIKLFIKLNSIPVLKPSYGNENGFISYLAFSLSSDGSVFLHEAIKYLKEFSDNSSSQDFPENFLSDLENVRNNVHTYNKRGGYQKKADNIIQGKLIEYEMDTPDSLYFLRSDISLIFEIVNNKRKFIGSDYFIYHSFVDIEGKTWSGTRFNKYAENLSAAIKGIATTIDDSVYQLAELDMGNNLPRIELFDYKSPDLFTRVKTNKPITLRLLLALTQISYPIMLVEDIIDITLMESTLWMCFFTKLMSIKYDETIDNINSILTHAESTDRNVVNDILSTNGIDINNLRARNFAQKLRNSIHYQRIPFDATLCDSGTTKEVIEVTYLSITETKTMDEFRTQSNHMFEEAKQLQNAIQEYFSLNKTY